VLIHGINTNEEIKKIMVKYIPSDVSLLPITLQNANINTLEHVRKKSCCL